MTYNFQIPISVRILLTKKCNLKCNYCLADAGIENENELNTQEWFQFFKRIKELKIFQVILSGGEIFLRQDIFELLERLRENRIHKIIILTNGTLINQNVANYLKNLNIQSIVLSLDGLEETHDLLRGKGSFKKTVEGLNNLIRMGIIPQIAFTPTCENYKDLSELIDFLIPLNIKFIKVNTLNPEGRCKDIYKGTLLKFPEQIKEILDVIDQKRTQYYNFKIDCEFGFYYYLPESYRLFPSNSSTFNKVKHLKDGCGAARTSFAITSTGDIIPCEGLPTFIGGNIRKQDILDLWSNSSEFKTIRDLAKISMDKVPKCKACKYIYLCDAGCRGNAYRIFNDLLAPDILCPYWDNPYIQKENSLCKK